MVLEIITGIPFATYWLILTTFALAIIYQSYFRNWNYFNQYNVKFIRGYPIVGAIPKLLFNMESFAEQFQKFYKQFKNERVFGVYEIMGSPTYVIRDPELIKQIAVTEFDHFTNRRGAIEPGSDPIMSRSLFLMKDQRWREMRATLSPSFTGSKMRQILTLINECSERYMVELKAEMSAGQKRVYNLRDLFNRIACDVIATSAFGIEVNSYKERDNDFYTFGISTTSFDARQTFAFIAYSTIPKIMNFFKIQFFTNSQINFFRQAVLGSMKYREENKIVRHDLIHLMVQSKNGKSGKKDDFVEDEKDAAMGFATVEESDIGKISKKITDWSSDDYVAQPMTFFLAGFQAVSSGLSFMCHELALNPKCQEKLFDEVNATHKDLNGKPLTYDVLQKMKYLDMVVSETLRRWTLAPNSDRIVTKPTTIENTNGEKINLNVGDTILIPTYSIHLDEKYYKNPLEFNPERFNDENKLNIKSGTYLPFGIGPRSCIGSRFALMEMKSVMYYIALNFLLEKCEQTLDPIPLRPGILLETKGFWLNFSPRSAATA